MESFRKTQNFSLIILSLGMVVSAHASDVFCGKDFDNTYNGQVIDLEDPLPCSAGDNPNYAVLISGDNIHFLLNGNSITAEEDDEPLIGISITGSGNHVTGPGTIEGFGIGEDTNGNIVIENAVNNHVSRLSLNEGENGVLILSNASGEDEQANGNHIYHNIVNNPVSHGILVLGTNDGSAQLNYIYHNSIQETMFGINVRALSGSSANNNDIYDKSIQKTSFPGIVVNSGDVGSADSNQIHDNSIHDIESNGILVLASGGSANENLVFLNHIIRPGDAAIALIDQGGFIADNAIGGNFATQPLGSPVYCDSSGQSNQWPVNTIGLQLVFGTPGPC